MTRLGRILETVTLRWIVAALLIGAFAAEILSTVSWLGETGLRLGEMIGLRAVIGAALRLVLDAALIYLAVRCLATLLGRRRHVIRPGPEDAAGPAAGPPPSFEATGRDADGRSRRGDRGGDGAEQDH